MASDAAPSGATATPTASAGLRRARWLALGGALLWLYASWAPWAIIIPRRTLVGPEPYVSPAGLGAFATVTVSPTLLGIVSSIGLLLCPWLWSRRFWVIAAALYLGWVVLASITALLALVGYAQVAGTLPLSLFAPVGAGIAPDFGLVLMLIGLALLWVVGLRLWRGARARVGQVGMRPALRGEQRERATHDASAEVFARTGLMSGGAGAVTAGVLIWALGYYLIPWIVAASCPDTAIVVGCAGISSGDVVAVAAAPAGAVLDPRIFLYAVPVVLGICGLLMIYAVRRLLINTALCVWVGAWAVTASAIVALGWIGRDHVQAEVAAGEASAHASTPAAAVAAIGVGIVWLGLVPLIIAALSTWRARAAAP
ncbi:MAG TPA: hypothetical protein VGR57_14205 [Ktedonobacterales bacterium]|nr:hypothetical protein [Ktedonobacterales bacterium]